MKKRLKNRCTGECCEDIGLDYSPSELRNSYQRWITRNNKDKDVLLRTGVTGEVPLWTDIFLVYPMLRFVKKNMTHPEKLKKFKRTTYHYTCVHFDKKNRKCEIYDIRPYMCRAYGEHGHICMNPKCQWKKQIDARKAKAKVEAKEAKQRKEKDCKMTDTEVNQISEKEKTPRKGKGERNECKQKKTV